MVDYFLPSKNPNYFRLDYPPRPQIESEPFDPVLQYELSGIQVEGSQYQKFIEDSRTETGRHHGGQFDQNFSLGTNQSYEIDSRGSKQLTFQAPMGNGNPGFIQSNQVYPEQQAYQTGTGNSVGNQSMMHFEQQGYQGQNQMNTNSQFMPTYSEHQGYNQREMYGSQGYNQNVMNTSQSLYYKDPGFNTPQMGHHERGIQNPHRNSFHGGIMHQNEFETNVNVNQSPMMNRRSFHAGFPSSPNYQNTRYMPSREPERQSYMKNNYGDGIASRAKFLGVYLCTSSYSQRDELDNLIDFSVGSTIYEKNRQRKETDLVFQTHNTAEFTSPYTGKKWEIIFSTETLTAISSSNQRKIFTKQPDYRFGAEFLGEYICTESQSSADISDNKIIIDVGSCFYEKKGERKSATILFDNSSNKARLKSPFTKKLWYLSLEQDMLVAKYLNNQKLFMRLNK